MARQLITGPNFSGRSDALRVRLTAGGPAFFVGPYAEAALSGLASTAADELSVYRADTVPQRAPFAPLDFEACADRKPQSLSGGEQVLLALQCFSQSTYGAIGIDTALEQLDGSNRSQAIDFLSQLDAGEVTLIDNRMAAPPPGWSSTACTRGTPGFGCDLAGLMAGLGTRAAPRIVIRDLDFRYRRGVDVFTGAALTLEPGHAYRLFGRNGAGKTTLLKILVGVLAPGRGEILLDDQPCAPWRHGNETFALATQNPDHQWCGATLREDVGRRRAVLKTSVDASRVSDQQIAAAAQKLGIASLDQHLYELPLAARKRLSWLWPLSGVMPWIMLDEPTVGQDRDTCTVLAAALAVFCRHGYGVLFVTHDDEFAGQVPHRMVSIENRRMSTS
jgi:energy-coupling factor transport system ATP-binding protein